LSLVLKKSVLLRSFDGSKKIKGQVEIERKSYGFLSLTIFISKTQIQSNFLKSYGVSVFHIIRLRFSIDK